MRGKDKSYLGGIPIAWPGGGVLAVATSSYAGEIQAAYHGFDTSRYLKSTISELLFGNGNISIGAMVRNDSSSVVEHVYPINSAAQGRMSNGALESNRVRWQRIHGYPYLILWFP